MVVRKGWQAFVSKQIKSWEETAIQWSRVIRKGSGIYHYENLVHDRETQFRKIINHIGLEVNRQRLDCVLKHDPKSFKRNHTLPL